MLVLKEIPELVAAHASLKVSQPSSVSGSDELSAQLGSSISKVVFANFILGGAFSPNYSCSLVLELSCLRQHRFGTIGESGSLICITIRSLRRLFTVC